MLILPVLIARSCGFIDDGNEAEGINASAHPAAARAAAATTDAFIGEKLSSPCQHPSGSDLKIG